MRLCQGLYACNASFLVLDSRANQHQQWQHPVRREQRHVHNMVSILHAHNMTARWYASAETVVVPNCALLPALVYDDSQLRSARMPLVGLRRLVAIWAGDT